MGAALLPLFSWPSVAKLARSISRSDLWCVLPHCINIFLWEQVRTCTWAGSEVQHSSLSRSTEPTGLCNPSVLQAGVAHARAGDGGSEGHRDQRRGRQPEGHVQDRAQAGIQRWRGKRETPSPAAKPSRGMDPLQFWSPVGHHAAAFEVLGWKLRSRGLSWLQCCSLWLSTSHANEAHSVAKADSLFLKCMDNSICCSSRFMQP